VRHRAAWLWVIAVAVTAVDGCTIAPIAPGSLPTTGSGELPPPGYGTLLQREISISLVSQDLQILVTPLDESVIRLTAPDTYRRLSSMANASARGVAGDRFLISFYSDQPDVRFVPEEIQLISGGLRLRPASITEITPTWGQHRVRQQQQETAIYTFADAVNLASDLVLVYGLERTRAWSAILPRLQAERARARARSGIGRR
jgi:hypothetical protein